MAHVGSKKYRNRLKNAHNRAAKFELLEGRQMMSAVLPFTSPKGSVKLTGNLVGTAGSYQSKGNTIANAMDGNTATFFDAPAGVQGWVGLAFASPEVITQVQYVPRSGYASRMVGGIFQGSDTPDFSADVTTLFTVTASPTTTAYTAQTVTVSTGFNYVRYLSPTSGSGNVAELEFDGFSATPPPPPPPPPALPLTPTALGAAGLSPTSVQLNWQEDPSSTVSSFTVERQGPSDATYIAIGSAAGTAGTYTDLTAQAGTTYSYEVVASNSAGSSSPATPVSVTTAPAPTNPWSDSDIGSVGFPGSAVVNPNGTITVTGSGADIWNQTDAFNYESQALIGNGSIIARVTAETNPNGWAKSGIMIRETLDSDSRFVMLALTPSNGVTLQARTATHTTPSVSILTPGKAGVWLELVRNNSTFTGYVSSDGVTWTQVGTVTIPMFNNVQAGLCVTAHDNTKSCTATFSNVTINPAGTPASAWSAGATGPLARWESADFTYNGLMYVFGGYTDRSLDATTECDAYNPATNTWSYVTAMPAGAITHEAVAVVGDTVYFAGGNIGAFGSLTNSTATAQVLTYNLDTGAWGSILSLPAAVTSGGLVCINNQLICYGGINATNTVDQSNTWSLDLTNPNAVWTAKAAMPNARNHIGYVDINGLAYAVGGEHLYKQSTGNLSEVDVYNPVTNMWKQVASLPIPIGGLHGTTMVVNGKIVIVGGQTNGGYDGIYQNGIYEFDPVANVWTSAGTLPEANQGQAIAYIDGELIVADGTVDNLGGWAQDQVLLDSQIML